MGRRFESGASKLKRKTLEEYMVKKLTPITAYLPLRAARSASDETDALIKHKGIRMLELFSQLLVFNRRKASLK